MQARSIKGKSPEEVQTELNDCISEGFKPTLAIVFLSIVQDRQAICSILNQEGIAIYGANSNGEFTEDGILKESIAIMLMDIHPDHFTILFEEYPGKNYRAVTQSMAKNAPEKFSHPAFLIAGSHMETDAEELLHGFEDIIGMQVNVYGGMAGDDYRFTEQFVFTNEKESNRGIVAVALDEDKLIINGVHALEQLEKHQDVDIVLSDINMPEMDGLTLLTELNEKHKLLKSVIVSAYGDMDNIRTAMNSGAFDFITKPINFQDLELTMEKTVRQVKQIQETIQAIKENNILKMYVDETVLHFMNSREFESSLMANETVDATVAFIDICSFTALSENETPDKVVGLLNNYFDVMVKEIIGDEVNTAQRLQVTAEEGQILITELNYEKIKESFECSRVGNMNLKNMVKPIVIYEVIE